MSIRISFVAAVLFAAASTASAQVAAPAKQVVISPTMIKAMTAQKAKTKMSLNARVGMKRASAATVVASNSAPLGPTSVRAVKILSPDR